MLPKKERLSRGQEINQVRQQRQFHFTSPLLQILARINQQAHPRLTVICPGRTGNAVKRNRAKRIITAVYSRNRHKINKNIDFVVVVKTIFGPGDPAEETIVRGIQTINDQANSIKNS